MEGSGAVVKPSTPKMSTLLIFILAMFVLFDQNLRNALGALVGYAFEPIIGFNGQYPVLTVILAGLLMSTLTFGVRFYFTDYVEQARSQMIMGAFNKEMKAARLDNNLYKIKKLTEQQQMVMSKSMEVSTKQLKTMPLTMLIVIPIFAWVWLFISGVASPIVSVPWSLSVSMISTYVLPAWILLYSLITVPYSQILNRIFRYFSFKRKLQRLEEEAGLA